MKFSLAHLTIRRPVATIMVVLMIVVLGFSAVIDIPRDLMPNMELPMALVMTSYPNASPEEVESMVTAPVEGALAAVENLSDMISYSMEGSSIVMIQFNYGTDMDMASLNMREKISLISDYLPDTTTEPMVMKLDMNTLPTMQLYVSADMPLNELNTLVSDNVVNYFERAAGVANVSVTGGLSEEIAVVFNQEKLENYGLSLATISQILAAENLNLPAGNVSKGDSEIIVRTVGKFSSAEEMGNIPLMASDYSRIRLSDVAEITQGPAEQTSITRIDGKTAVGIMVTKQSDANTADVSKALRKAFAEVQEKFPNLNIVIGYDQADYINSSLNSVMKSALSGALLAIIVVFIFLRNFRSTMVIGLSIPVSILLTFAIMSWRGITLNLVTLCALAIVVGMIVDNSIVVLENIYSTRQKIGNADEAAEKGTGEVFIAIIASTLTTVVVFLPIALTDGLASVMFGEFCYTMIFALLASLAVAISVVPMLCSKLMKGSMPTEYVRIGKSRYKYKLLPRFAAAIDRLRDWYGGVARKALRNRWKVILGCVCAFAISTVLVGLVGTELLPMGDEGSITVSVDLPYGTSLEKTDRIMSEIEEYILSIPELEHCAMNTESTSVMSLSGGASFTVNLCPKNERDRSTEEIAKDINDNTRHITGAKISATADSSIMGMFGSADIVVYLMGKDNDRLREMGSDVAENLNQLSLVDNAELSITEGNPEIKVVLNRSTAAYYGVTAYQLANGLSSALNGTKATNITIDGTDIAVKLSLNGSYSESIENMKQIQIMGNYGMPVSVGQIASFEYDNAPQFVGRYNQNRYVTINVSALGSSLSKASAQVDAYLSSYNLPDGYYFMNSGISDNMIEMFGSLFKALLVAIALVFLIMAAQFESAIMSFIVLMSIPFAMSGAFIALFVTGKALSLTSFLGLILLVGIVVNNSILLVEFINQNKETMGVEESLIAAGKQRLRPILMTTMTTCVGMIPLSLGFGDGGETLAPMGVAIIGGLMTSTALTLIVTPCLYSIVDEKKNRKAAKRAKKDAEVAALHAKWAEEDAAAKASDN